MLNAAAPSPEVQTIILTADTWLIPTRPSSPAPTPISSRRISPTDLWAAQLAAQDKFAAKFPWAEHITDTDAAHYIHNDNPQLVIDSIRDIVDQVRAEPPG